MVGYDHIVTVLITLLYVELCVPYCTVGYHHSYPTYNPTISGVISPLI